MVIAMKVCHPIISNQNVHECYTIKFDVHRPRKIVVDFRHRFTIINMNDKPVSLGQIYSFDSLNL